MLPISSKKKKAKLSDSDPEDSGIQTIFDKYSEEKEEMFSDVQIQKILKVHQELVTFEKAEEVNTAPVSNENVFDAQV